MTPRLPRISGADAVKVFQKAGFTNARQKGSHDYLFKQGHPLALSVPQHKELAPGTLHALIKKVNLTVDQFTELL